MSLGCCFSEGLEGYYPYIYHGWPAALANDAYIDASMLSTKIYNSVFDVLNYPNFTYNITFFRGSCYAACGDYGLVKMNMEGTLDPLATPIPGDKLKDWTMENVFLKYQTEYLYDSSETFPGSYEYTTGDIWYKDVFGSRYGYDRFRGVYDSEPYFINGDPYLIVAHGMGGISLLNVSEEQANKKYKGPEPGNHVPIITGFTEGPEEDADGELKLTVFNTVEVIDNRLFVGTCGYDPPKTEYEDYDHQDYWQPEYDYYYGVYHELAIYNPYCTFDEGGQGSQGQQGKNLEANGIEIYDIDKLLQYAGIKPIEIPITPTPGTQDHNKEVYIDEIDTELAFEIIGNPMISQIDLDGNHVNQLDTDGQNLYVAAGKNTYDNSGNVSQISGGLYKISKNEGDESQEDYIKNKLTSICPSSFDLYKQDIYFTSPVITQGSQTQKLIYKIDLTNGDQDPIVTNLNINNYKDVEAVICKDPDSTCFVFNPYDFLTYSFDGGFGSVVDSFINPTQRGINNLCHRDLTSGGNLLYPFYSNEKFGTIPTGIKIVKGVKNPDRPKEPAKPVIIVSFWQNGYSVYDLETLELQQRVRSYFNINSCENSCGEIGDEVQCERDGFLNSEEAALAGLGQAESDINPDLSISCGRIETYRGKVYIIDSIQYVANGAGPGIYNPFFRTNAALTKSSLLKGFQIFGGIIELGYLDVADETLRIPITPTFI